MTTAPTHASTALPASEGGRGFSRRDFLKLSGLSALSVAGVSFLAACGPAAPSAGEPSAEPAAGSSEAVLGDGKVLRVGMEAAYAPYNWQESSASSTTIPIDNVAGAYADGYDVQIAKKIAAALGMEAVAVKLSFDGLVGALNNGQIDIICAGMSATPERAQSVDFSDSYLDDGISVVTKKDSPYASATTLSDFSGAAVMGQAATWYDEVIDEIEGVNHLTPAETVPLVVENLSSGTCDAITFSSLSVPQLLKTYPDFVEVKLADGFSDPVMPDNAAIAKGNDAILAKVNEAIAAISDEERASIWNDCMERQPA